MPTHLHHTTFCPTHTSPHTSAQSNHIPLTCAVIARPPFAHSVHTSTSISFSQHSSHTHFIHWLHAFPHHSHHIHSLHPISPCGTHPKSISITHTHITSLHHSFHLHFHTSHHHFHFFHPHHVRTGNQSHTPFHHTPTATLTHTHIIFPVFPIHIPQAPPHLSHHTCTHSSPSILPHSTQPHTLQGSHSTPCRGHIPIPTKPASHSATRGVSPHLLQNHQPSNLAHSSPPPAHTHPNQLTNHGFISQFCTPFTRATPKQTLGIFIFQPQPTTFGPPGFNLIFTLLRGTLSTIQGNNNTRVFTTTNTFHFQGFPFYPKNNDTTPHFHFPHSHLFSTPRGVFNTPQKKNFLGATHHTTPFLFGPNNLGGIPLQNTTNKGPGFGFFPGQPFNSHKQPKQFFLYTQNPFGKKGRVVL